VAELVPHDRRVAELPARTLCGLNVVGPDGKCLGYISVTGRAADGRRLAITRRGHPRWQLLLVNLLQRRRLPRRGAVIALDSAYIGSDAAIHLCEVPPSHTLSSRT
jgi:hypothetical protein